MLLYNSLNRFYVLCVYCIYSSYQSLCVLCNLDMVWSWSSFSVEKKKKKKKQRKKKKSLALLPHSHPIPLLLYSLFSLHIILSFCTYCILLCGLIGRIWPAAMWWDVKMIIYLSIMHVRMQFPNFTHQYLALLLECNRCRSMGLCLKLSCLFIEDTALYVSSMKA